MRVSRLRKLYKTVCPGEKTFETNELIKDRFIHGMLSTDQRRYVPTAIDLTDDLRRLTQHASKYDAIQVSLKPNVSTKVFLTTRRKADSNGFQSTSPGGNTQLGEMVVCNPSYRKNGYQYQSYLGIGNKNPNTFRGPNDVRYQRRNNFNPRLGQYRQNKYTGFGIRNGKQNNNSSYGNYGFVFNYRNSYQANQPNTWTQNYRTGYNNRRFINSRVNSNRCGFNYGRMFRSNPARFARRGRQQGNRIGNIQNAE